MKITKTELKEMIRTLVQESTANTPKFSVVTAVPSEEVMVFTYNGEDMYNPQLLGKDEIRKELGKFDGQTITIKAYDHIGKRKPKNVEIIPVEVIVDDPESEYADEVILVAEDGEIRYKF